MLKNFIKQSRFLSLCRAITILSVLFHQSAAAAAGIVAVQSINVKPYNDALSAFKSKCNCYVKHFVLSEMGEADVIKKIYDAGPDVILAIGIDALNKVKIIKNIPVVYLMVLNPQSMISDEDNITGVSMNIAPKKQLSLLQQALPDLKSIGLLYDPARTGPFVKNAQLTASAMGLVLIAREVHNSKDVPALLKSMKGEINAFWMLPDVTVVTPETVEFLLLFSIENRIPLITFSDKYVELGALMSLDIDAHDMGQEAWEITKEILSGTGAKKIAKTDARNADITINQRTAKKLRITISDKILSKAKVIN